MAYLTRYMTGGTLHVIPPELVGLIDTPSTAKRATVARRDMRRRVNTIGRRYVLAEVAERDGFRCHLCRKPVDMSLSGRHPQGPTADHLVPVACGGGDDPQNIRLAHSRCNIKRGVGGTVQLALV